MMQIGIVCKRGLINFAMEDWTFLAIPHFQTDISFCTFLLGLKNLQIEERPDLTVTVFSRTGLKRASASSRFKVSRWVEPQQKGLSGIDQSKTTLRF